MVESKGWSWDLNQAQEWETPSEDSYYYLWRWRSLGFTKLLDLGCGLGRHALQFAREGYSVDAFDLSPEGLVRLKKQTEAEQLTIRITEGDMMKLPYGDEQFDCLFSFHCIYHTDKAGLNRVLSEISRVLRPGGELFLTLNSKSNPSFRNPAYTRIDGNTLLKTHGPEIDVPHCYLDEEEVREVMAGFELLRLRHIQDFHEGGSGWHFFIHARRG